jgi:hypothetical protein
LGDADISAQARSRVLSQVFASPYSMERLETLRRALRPALATGGMLRWMPYEIEVK